MKKLIGISLVLAAVLGLAASEAFAGRGGGRVGGQQSARGRSGFNQYGYGNQTGIMQQQMMQRQMMQNRYGRMQSGRGGQGGAMQQRCLMDGSCVGQSGYGGQGGRAGYGGQGGRAMQGRGGNRQSGYGNRGGMMHGQRLRDGSGGGQFGGQAPVVPLP